MGLAWQPRGHTQQPDRTQHTMAGWGSRWPLLILGLSRDPDQPCITAHELKGQRLHWTIGGAARMGVQSPDCTLFLGM